MYYLLHKPCCCAFYVKSNLILKPDALLNDNYLITTQEFGQIHSVNVLRDKESGNPKGFGFVRFLRPYHAALALENCDRCKSRDINAVCA